ncbi:ParM/StbA family protein [Herpetosiphon geysericola]|uniref:Actin homologue MreB-like C-terminal domain-containing protein n=1 Tax=Herpetosiphon geysericola TaxID=70996 RepID=A0A0P6YEY9_9CHLR|nr:ParM/StbA family protein [Herpetosiphon geysericola]KPL90750.1 hypothetical protein SE18_05125 [Herpetosiphon geysericola]
MTTIAYKSIGINAGHGYTKVAGITSDGRMVEVRLPSQLSPASAVVTGAISMRRQIYVGGNGFWVGEDASGANPRTDLTQGRLDDPVLIPALVRKGWALLGSELAPNGFYVSCLPATWAMDQALCGKLAGKLRYAGVDRANSIRIIPEPLGLAYDQLLDVHGQSSSTFAALEHGIILVVDIGHNTLDFIVLNRMVPMADSLESYGLGTSGALNMIRARLSARYDRPFSVYETDLAIRSGSVMVAGQARDLYDGWDAPIGVLANDIVATLASTIKSGAQFDAILIGGGGAELGQITTAIRDRYQHAIVVEDPQGAIARGCAKLGARLAAKHAA